MYVHCIYNDSYPIVIAFRGIETRLISKCHLLKAAECYFVTRDFAFTTVTVNCFYGPPVIVLL